MSEYVTEEDLVVPDCECGCWLGKHASQPHHYGWRSTECDCRKGMDDLRLANLDRIVRREVAKALRDESMALQALLATPGAPSRAALFMLSAKQGQRADAIENGGQS